MERSIYTAPQIVRETCSGYSRIDLQDAMLANREIMCVGEIDSEAANSLIAQLLYLQQDDPDSEIVMYFNSPGGEVSSGLALYDVMRAICCPIRTICTGVAASMAAVLFASGRVRNMLAHSRIMIHDPLISRAGGSALVINSLADDLMRTRQAMAEILSEHTGNPIEKILEATAKDTYFTAQAAIDFGLADDIITQITPSISKEL